MRVLITWGTKHGGTESIAKIVAETLAQEGHATTLAPANKVRNLDGYGAVVIGGAVYANRWQRDARHFVNRQVRGLRRLPVWCFSSGPLDHSADEREIPPCPELSVLMERIGARGHHTFGGRLAQDAHGFPASAMAKTRSGDYRNPKRIRAWATHLAHTLPLAQPGIAVDPPARSVARLAAHGAAGWALYALLLILLQPLHALPLAAAFPSVAATAVFVGIALHYFGARGAREPIPTSLAFLTIFSVLDATLSVRLVTHSADLFANLYRFWLPLVLVFLVTWATGEISAMFAAALSSPRRRNSARIR